MSPLSKDLEERVTPLMLIQKPDCQLRNTISQVKPMSASLKLIPTVSLGSQPRVNPKVVILGPTG